MRIKNCFYVVLLCLLWLPVSGAGVAVQPWLLMVSHPSASASGDLAAVSLKGISYYYLNPAATGGVKNIEFSASHCIFPLGISSGQISLSRNFGFGVITVEGARLDFGGIESLAYGQGGGPESLNLNIKPEAYYISLGISKAAAKTFIGASVRLSSEDLGAGASYMVAADAGVLVNDALTDGLGIGISVSSITAPQGNFEPPMNVRAGASYAVKGSGSRILTAGAGFEYLIFESSVSFDAGIDFNLADTVSIRASVKSGHTGGVTYGLGAGFDFDNLRLDYSFSPGIYTGAVHRAGVSSFFERQSFYDEAEPVESEDGERSYESYVKSGDYYYRVKQYRRALKYYEYINLFFWKDLEKRGDRERSSLYQKMGISYYSVKDEARSLHYFEQASYYDRSNEILKFWIKTLKQD